MIDALQPGLNLEEILRKAGTPLRPQQAYEFANNLPPGPEGTRYPGQSDLVEQFWLGVGRGSMALTLDRKMALKEKGNLPPRHAKTCPRWIQNLTEVLSGKEKVDAISIKSM